ncbi:MAG: carbohydrate-binding protein [Clostridia bacterium]|nr:carbohydrate-binding protein [Clostridia bacterium]
MYFSHQQYCIGVAVSENGPGGPYRDALGKPLIPKGMVDTACYDPTVFIDDDEARTPYIMFGFTCIGKKYYVARLNEDMISLAEPPRPVELEPNWDSDACWITKHGGTYYLTTHEARFATSKSIYGPYTYHGKFMYDYTVDHGTFFTYHNQTYFTYGVPENLGDEKIDPYYRTTKIVYAHFKDDGAIVTDDFIKIAGVGQYDAGWDVIKGEWYFAASDGIYKKENEDGFEIRGIGNGSYLYYQNVNSMRQNAPVELRLSNGNKEACTVEIRENSPFGAVLGSFRAGYTGGFDKFETFRLELDNAYGTHNLCFVFYSEAEEAVRFEDFRFTKIRP